MANYTFSQLEALVAQAGGTKSQQEILAGIAAGVESGGNPTAQNSSSTASGLWQELTSTWLSNGGAAYAPTAKQASPLDQAIVAVNQSKNGYQPWAPDLGGSYYGGITNPTSPLPGSPVANYLASQGQVGPSSSLPAGADTAGATGGAGSATPGAIKLEGMAGVLQQINDLLNPATPGFASEVTSLGTASVGTIIATIAVRGLFSVVFLGLTYVGIKSLTAGGGSSGPSISDVMDQINQNAKNDLAQQRIDTRNREIATPRVYERRGGFTNSTTVTHKTTKAPKANTAPAEAAAKPVTADLAEGALEIL